MIKQYFLVSIDIFWFRQYFNEVKMLSFIKSFGSGNLTHCQLELRKSNWNGTGHEWNKENQTRTK
jgi:hypothetical protein